MAMFGVGAMIGPILGGSIMAWSENNIYEAFNYRFPFRILSTIHIIASLLTYLLPLTIDYKKEHHEKLSDIGQAELEIELEKSNSSDNLLK